MSDQRFQSAYLYLRSCPLTARQHEEIRGIYDETVHLRGMISHYVDKIERLEAAQTNANIEAPTWTDMPDSPGLWLRRRFTFGRPETEFIEINEEMEARRLNETFGKLDRFGRGGWYGPIPEGK